MSQKVVLLDLENNAPTLTLLREVLQHYSHLYVFNCTGKFEFALDDLTEFAGWVSSGQVIVLDVPESAHKEYEYAVLVGQLMALLDEGSEVELISAMPSSEMLMQMLDASAIPCHLIQVQPAVNDANTPVEKPKLPSNERILASADLQKVKQYCDALGSMSGKPTNIEALKNSIVNILQLDTKQTQKMLGMLISLKIVKQQEGLIHFRKKVLKQWLALDLNAPPVAEQPSVDLSGAVAQLQTSETSSDTALSKIQATQQDLFKNFGKIDPVHMEVARKLRALQGDKPKDIYELRDLLEELFPKSDIRLLLKELLEKGYIYWDGHDVRYSHEMFLN